VSLPKREVKLLKPRSRLLSLGNASSFGACALDAEDFINGLDSLVSGSPDGNEIGKSIESLVGYVGDRLAYLLTHPGAALQSLGLP
jgi:hypothetical protein